MNRHGTLHASEQPAPVSSYVVARCGDCDKPMRGLGNYTYRYGTYRLFGCGHNCGEHVEIADVDLMLEYDESWDEWDGVLVILTHDMGEED